MASTIEMVGRAVQLDEAVLNGLKRSRFSLHFKTLRVRHWILVQLVRIPIQAVDERETVSAPWLQFRQIKGTRTTIERLVDDYMVAQFARQWA